MPISNPPFKLAVSPMAIAAGAAQYRLGTAMDCCAEAGPEARGEPTVAARARLADLDPHLHCSLIGTCISTAELRKLMSRFIDVQGASDLEVHHEAVRLASQDTSVAKALHKALDQRHDATVRRFARAADADALVALWEEALRQGEIPGAYWAVLTHRGVTPDLRQRVFGDVHMLSHLVGAANRADIRRLVALERENEELRARLEQHQLRSREQLDERDQRLTQLEHDLAEARRKESVAVAALEAHPWAHVLQEELQSLSTLVAVQTERRERAEQLVAAASDESARLVQELTRLERHARELSGELAAAETQLREAAEGTGPGRSLESQLRGRRILYVGGRPSSAAAIRDLVHRHGGEIDRHDGGLEDRKGLLAAAIPRAQLVVFPVDCIDHDSAGSIKRLCARAGVAFLPLRSASVASFAAALSGLPGNGLDGDQTSQSGCFRNR